MPVNPYDTYKKQSVMTMTSGDLLISLYDELLKQLNLAKQSFAQNNMTEINKHLQKSQLIITHLNSTLNDQYEISKSLHSLYDYFMRTIIQSNIHKSTAELDDIISMINDLRNTYAEADRLSRSAASGE